VPHVYVHFLGDGQDTAPRSAASYARELHDYIQKVSIGQVGRYYAMDRDKRWDRVKIAIDGLVHGKGEAIAEDGDYVKAIEARV
jgi:2,3-bisphosphoglycerate-independent phosphoglycerate mutase